MAVERMNWKRWTSMVDWRALLKLALLLPSFVGPGSVGAAQCAASPNDDQAALSPSPAEIRALVPRVVANQHLNDTALEQYERIERRQVRKSEQDTTIAEDKTFRVVPTGTGMIRVQTEEDGRPVDAELYRRQLRGVEQALASALNPADPRQKHAVEKGAKRSRERAELVDEIPNAFLFSWLGRETHNGRALIKLALEPNPAFKPASRKASLFTHVRATVWVHEATGQLVRLEAEMIRDFPVGGGVIGKVYRGGRFVLEQAEVAPGVWLPTRYQYDFDGRKFLFGFGVHELTEASRYRHIGPPKEALETIRRELNDSRAADPAR